MPRRRAPLPSSNREQEGDDAPTCWICLGQERRDAQLGALRSPCACRGSVGHVHERCLQEWVQTRARSSVLPGLPSCPTCKQRYRGDLVLLLAASSALQLQLDLPPSAESRLVTELQNRRMNKEANALLRRRMRWNVLVADELHSETMQGFCNVALAMRELKQLDAAAVLLRRVLKCAERLLGGSSQLQSWSSLLWGIRKQMQRPTAVHLAPAAADWEIEEEEEMWQDERRRALAIALDAVDVLAEVLAEQGRPDEAERQLARKKALSRRAWLLALREVWWLLPQLLLLSVVTVALFATCLFLALRS